MLFTRRVFLRACAQRSALPRAARAIRRAHPSDVPGGTCPRRRRRARRHRGVVVRARAALGRRARVRAAAGLLECCRARLICVMCLGQIRDFDRAFVSAAAAAAAFRRCRRRRLRRRPHALRATYKSMTAVRNESPRERHFCIKTCAGRSSTPRLRHVCTGSGAGRLLCAGQYICASIPFYVCVYIIPGKCWHRRANAQKRLKSPLR